MAGWITELHIRAAGWRLWYSRASGPSEVLTLLIASSGFTGHGVHQLHVHSSSVNLGSLPIPLRAKHGPVFGTVGGLILLIATLTYPRQEEGGQGLLACPVLRTPEISGAHQDQQLLHFGCWVECPIRCSAWHSFAGGINEDGLFLNDMFALSLKVCPADRPICGAERWIESRHKAKIAGTVVFMVRLAASAAACDWGTQRDPQASAPLLRLNAPHPANAGACQTVGMDSCVEGGDTAEPGMGLLLQHQRNGRRQDPRGLANFTRSVTPVVAAPSEPPCQTVPAFIRGE